MKLLGTHTVEITSLILPADIGERQQREGVKRLATSIDEIGLLHTPVVRLIDRKLLVGGDRIAACILAGRDKVLVQMAECTDEEIPRLELMENYYRRHDEKGQSEAVRAAVASLTEQYEREEPEPRPQGKPGRPRTPRAKAVEVVAALKNVSRQAIEKAISEPPALDVAIDTFGLPTGDEFKAEVLVIRHSLDAADHKLHSAMVTLKKLSDSNTTVPRGPLDRAREQLSGLRQLIRTMYPSSLCPWCKGMDPYQGECPACLGSGWVSKETAGKAKEELRDREHLAICTKGKIELLEPVTQDDLGGLF